MEVSTVDSPAIMEWHQLKKLRMVAPEIAQTLEDGTALHTQMVGDLPNLRNTSLVTSDADHPAIKGAYLLAMPESAFGGEPRKAGDAGAECDVCGTRLRVSRSSAQFLGSNKAICPTCVRLKVAQFAKDPDEAGTTDFAAVTEDKTAKLAGLFHKHFTKGKRGRS